MLRLVHTMPIICYNGCSNQLMYPHRYLRRRYVETPKICIYFDFRDPVSRPPGLDPHNNNSVMDDLTNVNSFICPPKTSLPSWMVHVSTRQPSWLRLGPQLLLGYVAYTWP
jgi:hypothetical protein